MEPLMQILWNPDGFSLQKPSLFQQGFLFEAEPIHLEPVPSDQDLLEKTDGQTPEIETSEPDASKQNENKAIAQALRHPDPQTPLFWELLDEKRAEMLYSMGYVKAMNGSPELRYLWSIARVFITNLAMNNALEVMREQTRAELSDEDRQMLLDQAPFGNGRQWITSDWLDSIWALLQEGFYQDARNWTDTMTALLKSHQPDLQPAQRVYFHLIENTNTQDSGLPFAFLATYAIKTSTGRLRHVPLSHVFQEFDKSDPRLLSMLTALSKAADISPLLDDFLVTGDIFHPLMLTGREAWELLKAIPDLEKIGICSRIPNWWKKKSASASIAVTMGGKKPSLLGMDTILTMKPSLMINGRKLTKKEIKDLLAMDEGLYLLKGSWVEVDHKKLQNLLDQMEKYEGEISLSEALHMSAGLQDPRDDNEVEVEVLQAKWLENMMEQLRQPSQIAKKPLPKSVHATLRPYQSEGIKWLSKLGDLGFGACLADDMGLGKTLQMLAYLESWRQKNPDGKVLLAAPASLMGNWEKEIQKFTPEMSHMVLHPSRKGSMDIQEKDLPFLTITTYGMLSRIPMLAVHEWDYLVLDEAQAIKNVNTRQTKTVKSIPAKRRVALTGTPVENDLSNLWSLFDFLNKGLLGSRKEFSDFAKSLEDVPENYSRLKQMISPFLLRRLKTDPAIAPDLPEKLEKTDYIQLSSKQTALYHKLTSDLETKLLESSETGIKRKGMILSALMRLKQICNHPDQYTGQPTYDPKESGKFQVLKEICENIKEQHECVLVFTQFKEIIPQLDSYLQEIFGAPGLTIDGSTPPAKRTEMTERFNAQKEYIPYMVLSLKAAGTGLNLTAASHVIHFDRWWNPAVENQATDRAYRIGQHKNVVVHKFVSAGTIEEKIDEMIESKKELAEKVVETSQAGWITELSNKELINLLKGGF